MFDTDEMTDSAELSQLRDSLSGVAVSPRPRLKDIKSRGGAIRRQHRARVTRLSITGAAASTALAVGLTGALSPSPALGTIRTASFTLHHNHNGTDTLTINPKELLDPAQLQNDLAKYGIPARVTDGSYCTSSPEPSGFSQVVSTQPSGSASGSATAGPTSKQPTVTIDPSAMPSGTELSVGDFKLRTGQFAGSQQADMDLITTNSYTCNATPPTLGPGTPGMGLLYGGPGPG